MARNVTIRPHVSLLRAVTSTSLPSSRSGSGCSMPPRHDVHGTVDPDVPHRLAAIGPDRPQPHQRRLAAGLLDQRASHLGVPVDDHLPSVPHRSRCRRMGAVTDPAARPSTVGRPPRADLVLMGIGVLAVSTSGPLMAAIAAPALAVALWRNVPRARRRSGPRRWPPGVPSWPGLSRRELRWAVGAGVLLALHFATWMPSLRYTSVASATAIVATQPVWVALIARATGHDVPRRAWLGIAHLAGRRRRADRRRLLAGAAALIGDLLALLGGIFAALYTVAGAEVRRTVSTTSYTLALLLHGRRSPCSSPASSARVQLARLQQHDLAAAARR